jgi:very-short-patch-repair endonuclease
MVASNTPMNDSAALIRRAIADWRDSLINLSGRNRLLNFKYGTSRSKTSTVEFVRPSSQDILNGLVRNREYRFRSLVQVEDPDTGEVAPEPPEDSRILDSAADEKELAGALRNLYRKSTAEYLDRGVRVLYLAFGMLTWIEEDGTKYTSPILFVPVQLMRQGPHDMPHLTATEEDPAINPALALKMGLSGVALPTVDELEELSLPSLLSGVRSAVSGRRGWAVSDAAVLSYFSFHKEAMYRDLLDNEDQIAESALIGALAAGGRGFEVGDLAFEVTPDDKIDTLAAPETAALVLDADSSQRACIASAVDGRSFVMDGPPGTGKSQTIANMIGALLKAGKSVLFVSEKAAALEVVRNRLTEAGLDAYLLELHSHKATRKEVAAALGQALERVLVPPAPMSAMEMGRAAKRREELSAYAAAMNVPREPLGYSLHDVLGMVALLSDIPVAPATGIAPVNLAVGLLAQLRETTATLSRAWRPASQGATFVWRGVTGKASLDSRIYQTDSALQTLRGLTLQNESTAVALGLLRPSDAATLARILEQLAIWPVSTPDRWLTMDDLDETSSTVALLAQDLDAITAQEQVTQIAAGVAANLLPDPSTIPSLPDVALSPPALSVRDLTAEQVRRAAQTFAADADLLETRLTSLAGIATMLGLPSLVTFADADNALAIANVAFEADRPLRGWLSNVGQLDACYAGAMLEAAKNNLTEAETAARPFFTDAALIADLPALTDRFTHQHHGLRKLGSRYRADKKAVAAFTVAGLTPRDAHKHLDLAEAWAKGHAAMAHADATHAPLLGAYYVSNNTDWERLARALRNARTAVTHAGLTDLTKAGDWISFDAPINSALHRVVIDTSKDLSEWKATLAPAPLPTPRPELLTLQIDEAAQWLHSHGPLFEAAEQIAESVSHALGHSVTTGHALELLKLRASSDAAHARLADNGPRYSDTCEDLFRGRLTNIEAVTAALRWVSGLRAAVTGADVPFMEHEVKSMRAARQTGTLLDALTTWNGAKTALLAAFDEQRQTELRAELDDYDDAADLLNALRADSGGKDEWFAYVGARAALADNGLDEAVNFCIAERIEAALVPQVIERALLSEWADHFLATDNALGTVRAEDRDALVREYRVLDKALIASAASSIITSVNAKRPRSGIGEAAVIGREAAKKKKHMPVRILMERTKHVVQTIKPCFMMSPLAVSQFLPPDLHFDVVIFDEASQVTPADSINCIYRGKALITAGDQKQLPPTAFFATSSDDGSDEWVEEEDTGQDFESILDLAKGSGALHSQTLRWHYRSRHEALIAFSNAAFYDGTMVTFPGAEDHGPDVGVELFKVDGVYRRGSSRDNPIEAAKVAERVIHHYQTRPHRSLGVVTFSETQAATIEFAVERARADHPHLDRFFTNDRLDGFFVKNLESVQGDERDVMIFSVGYGPDEAGKITMNFGPINKAGGWRRLNVAITRARYRNEIVSSITAGDITVSTNSEGARQLRRYLDYAARGVAALALETGPAGDAESPFEESVLRAIRSWGYDVVSQVGTAGYRIDIGVRSSYQPGVYALGVECDGFQYHSSKVARDRDRLREQVLRGLGWRLHRIWGTAWYRNRTGEEARLREAIKAAMVAPIHGLLADPDVTDVDHIERPAVAIEQVELAEHPSWAVPYQVAHVNPLPRWVDPGQPGSQFEMRDGIEQIVTAEGPVHVTVIYQRLRDTWNIGRIGSRIRDNIDAAIRSAQVLREGDFVSLPNLVHVVVRTPTDGCARTIEQVPNSELQAAITNYVGDCIGVSPNTLTTAVARLYGWGRRGSEIQARLDDVVRSLLVDGCLAGNEGALTVVVSDIGPSSSGSA